MTSTELARMAEYLTCPERRFHGEPGVVQPVAGRRSTFECTRCWCRFTVPVARLRLIVDTLDYWAQMRRTA